MKQPRGAAIYACRVADGGLYQLFVGLKPGSRCVCGRKGRCSTRTTGRHPRRAPVGGPCGCPFTVERQRPPPHARPRAPSTVRLDGSRTLAYKTGDRIRLVSRNGVDHTRRFRAIAVAIAKLWAARLVLDGEVAI